METLSLHEALDVFSDNLPDIRAALIDNMSADLELVVPPPTVEGELQNELWAELYTLEVEQLIHKRKIALERINSRLQPRSIQQRAGQITEDDVERARQFPIDQMYGGRLMGPESGRRFGHCPFHQEKSASFCIHPNKGEGERWSCFGACNEHGDAIAYKMKADKVDFLTAVRELIR